MVPLAVAGLSVPAHADWVAVYNESSDAPALVVVRTACITSDKSYGFPINKGNTQWHLVPHGRNAGFETPVHCLDKSKAVGWLIDALNDALPKEVNLDFSNYYQAVVVFPRGNDLYATVFPPPKIGIPLSKNDKKVKWMTVNYFNALNISDVCSKGDYCLTNGDAHALIPQGELVPFVRIPGGAAVVDKLTSYLRETFDISDDVLEQVREGASQLSCRAVKPASLNLPAPRQFDGETYVPIKAYGEDNNRRLWISYYFSNDEAGWCNAWGYIGWSPATQVPGSVPLWNYANPNTLDRVYTTKPIRNMGSQGYQVHASEIAGYVFTSQRQGTVPLFRYRGSAGNHWLSTDTPSMHPSWIEEGWVGYIYPP